MVLNTPKQLAAAFKKYGSLKEAGRKTKTSYGKVHYLYELAMAEGLMDKLPRGRKTNAHLLKTVDGKLKVKRKPLVEGKRRATKIKKVELPKKGVTRFLLTCAQNNTFLHNGLWLNLLALAEHYDAQLHVSRFAYIKNGLGARGDKLHWFDAQEDEDGPNKNPGTFQQDSFWFDPEIEPYVSDQPLELAPGLIWRGDYNILPTASRPLSGLETVTGRKSGIFPHVKIAMESVPSGKDEPTKFNYTTGTVTQRNYIHRKEGLKAEFHHCYGALLVEVENETGDWWVRQLNADSEGTIYDLDVCVKSGVVTTGNAIEAITAGDIHRRQIDKQTADARWSKGGVVDVLRPRFQFLHDVLDFFSRSHHEIDDVHREFFRFLTGQNDVRAEGSEVAEFLLTESHRPWCTTVVVNSNHDRAAMRWLKERSGLRDPVNAEFWLALQSRVYAAIRTTHREPIILREIVREVTGKDREPNWLRFLDRDESFIICKDAGGGIQCGQHGDDGPNGSRGTRAVLARLGRKANVGHSHSAGITDGIYQAGTASILAPAYLHGPSSWSHSDIITYKNGKRAILTYWNGKAWAAR